MGDGKITERAVRQGDVTTGSVVVSRAARAEVEKLERRVLLDATLPAAGGGASAHAITGEVAPYLPPQTFLSRDGGLLAGQDKGKPADVAKRYLKANAAALGITARDLSGMRVTDQYTDADTGVAHVYFRQRVNGIDVANTSLSVHLTRDNEVIAAGGGFVSGAVATAGGLVKPGKARRAAAAALKDAARAVGIAVPAADEPKVVKKGDHVTRPHTLRAPWASKDDVPAKLQYVATAEGLTLAWNVVLRTPDGGHWYDASVDANTGAVVAAGDWVSHATYNVQPAPTESPADGPRQTLTDPHDPVASPFGWHDTNGVAGPEFTDTRGNNVSAQEDADANNTGGYRPSGGAGLAFDYPLDLTQSPSAYRDAAITNLFYWNNHLHDVHARYGFTEAAGNFQTRNYGGTGQGNDAVLADAQDGTGTNNANFATPPDGQAPRMQMYLFNKTLPGRDADLDNQLIIHEYGHGVSNRLTGGPSIGNTLTATQSAGMGEGWGDWWALMLTQKPTDTKTGAYPFAAYVMGHSPTTGAGFRRYPYSFDMSVNPLTFDAYNHDASKQVHNTGEIWASALWDMNWLLIDKHGFSPTIDQGYDPAVAGRDGGNNLALQLVMDGLKLQPANPSFVQARDAILAADVALTGGENQGPIWQAFARRGLGVGAFTSSSNSGGLTHSDALPANATSPRVTSHAPAGARPSAVSSVDLTFSRAMDPASFAVADDVASFTGPGGADLRGAITGHAWSNGNHTLRVTFAPQSAVGTYALTVGPGLRDIDGGAMDQDADGTPGEAGQDAYAATFAFDPQAMVVTGTTPAEGAVFVGALTTFDVQFNRAVDPATVAATDLVLSRGSVTAASVVDPTTVRFTVTGVTAEGLVTATLPAGAVGGTAAGVANEAFATTFLVDGGPTAFPTSFSSPGAFGSRAYTGSVTGAGLSTPADQDPYTIRLDAGQMLSATVVPVAGLRTTFELRDPSGAVVATAASPAPGQTAVLQPVGPLAAGTYTMTVAGTAGSGGYTLNVAINAAREAEPLGGPTNNTAATAQPLDAAFNYAGGPATSGLATVIGAATANDVDNYSVDLAAGDLLTAALDLTFSDPGSTTNLRVLDPAGNELSVAYSALTGSTTERAVPGLVAPVAGRYTVRVTTAQALTTYTLLLARNVVFDNEPNNGATAAQPLQAWPAAAPGVLRAAGGLGSTDVDYYALTLAAGELMLATTATPGDAANMPPNQLDPELTLYGTNGLTVLTSNTNGAPDGRNALLAYIAPTAGTYYLAIESGFSGGDYALTVTGAAAPALPFAVSTSSPAGGAGYKTAGPTQVSITFNDAVLAPTLQAADLTLDGVPALTVAQTTSRSYTFTVPSVTATGTHTLAIAAGAVADVQGTPVAAFSSTFTVEAVGPRVLTSTVAEGDARGTAAGSVVFTFDEPIQTVTAADLTLRGTFRDVAYAPASVSLSADKKSLTVGLPVLPEDRYALTLLSGSGNFEDPAGNSLDGEATWPLPATGSGNGTPGGNFVVNFTAEGPATAAFPALLPLAPGGTLAWANTPQGGTAAAATAVVAADDVDAWTTTLEAGRLLTLTAAAAPGSTLRPVVELVDAGGTVVAAATAAAAGGGAVVQSFAVPSTGTYTIRVSAAAGVGAYALRAAADAAAEAEAVGGPADDAPATAQNIDGSFVALGGGASRGVVTGQAPAGGGVVVRSDGFDAGPTIGSAWALYNSAGATNATRISATAGVGGSGALVMDATGGSGFVLNEAVWTLDLTGAVSPTLTFDHRTYADEQDTLPATFAGRVNGDGVAVSGDGVNWTRVWDGADSTATWANKTIDLAAVLAAAGIPLGPGVRVKLQQYDDGTGGSDGRGWDNVAVTQAGAPTDHYAFTLAAGDVVTAGVARQGTTGVLAVTLLDPSGAAVAAGAGGSTGYPSLVAGYVAPAAGTYYAAVAGADAAYAVVVARNAGLEAEPNDAIAAATPFDPARPALGGIAAAGDVDHFRFAAAAGVPIVVATETPGDAAGEPGNALNPTLELYDVNSVLVASNDNGAADGRNARLTYTPPAAGFYRVRVAGSGTTTGDYVLRVTGTGAVAIPGTPDLAAASDTGASDADNVTNRNDAGPGRTLTFTVPQTVPGATVTVYVGATAVASAVAAGTTTTLTTDGTAALPDGVYDVTARQAVPGLGLSPDSLPLSLTVDTVAPAKPAAPDLQPGSDTGVSDADDVTTSTTLTLTVNAVPYFRAFVDGARVGGPIATGTTFVTPTLADGVHALAVSAVDVAGNESPRSEPLNVTVDNAGPTAPAGGFGPVALGAAAYDFTVTYADPSGVDASTFDGNDVRVTGPGGFFNQLAAFVSADPAGNGTPRTVTYRVAAPGGTWDAVDSGTYTVTLQASQVKDVAGTAAATAVVGTFNASLLPATAAPDLDANYDSGASNTDDLTLFNNATLVPRFLVTGTTPGMTVTVYADGVAIGSATTSGASTTVFGAGTVTLADGVRMITARQSAAGGAVVSPESPALAMTVDTVAPTAVLAASDVTVGGGTEHTVTVTYADPSGVNVAAFDSSDVWFRGPGVQRVANFVSADVAGNGTPRTATYRVPATGGTWDVNDNGTYTLFLAPNQVPDGAGNAVKADVTLGTFRVAILVPLGQPALVNGTDSGHYSNDGLTRFNNASPASAPQVSVTGTVPGAVVELLVDGVVIGSATATGGTAVVTGNGSTAVADGPHTITLRQTPSGGTTSAASPGLAVTVDTVAPATPPLPDLTAATDSGASDADDVTNVARPTIDFGAGPHYEVIRDGVAGGFAFDAGAYTPTFALADGTHTFAAIATDLAGNVSPAGPTLSVTIDTVAPATPAGGALDPSFGGGDGWMVDAATTWDDAFHDVAVQPDGKIVAAGRVGLGSGQGIAVLARYGADGAPDPSFGSGGFARLNLADVGLTSFGAVAVLPDGKLLVGGSTYTKVNGNTYVGGFLLARYEADGTLDPTFGTDGVTVATGDGRVPGAGGMAVAADGRVVLAGRASAIGSAQDMAVARFTTAGQVDTTFGSGGWVYTDTGSTYEYATAVAIDAAGRVVVTGSRYRASQDQDIVVARYTTAGALDPSFAPGGGDGDGILVADYSAWRDEAAAVLVRPNGRIVVAGRVGTSNGIENGVLLQFDSAGAPDASFGSAGKAVVDLGAYEAFFDMALGADGRIVASGYTNLDYTGKLIVSRFTPGGATDPSFGTGGTVLTTVSANGAFGNAIAIDRSGSYVVGGVAWSGQAADDDDLLLARYLPGGGATLDLRPESDSGASDTDDVTAVAALTFDVTGAAPYYRVFRDGAPVGPAYGSGSVASLPPQPDGTWSYAVAPVDAAGNVGFAGAPLYVTIEAAAPAAPQVTAWRSVVTPAGAGEVDRGVGADGSYVESRFGGGGTLVLSLSAAVDPASVSPAGVGVWGNAAGGAVPGLGGVVVSTALRAGGTELVVSFAGGLPDAAKYLVRVSGLRDAAGNALAASERRFAVLRGDVTGDGKVDVVDLGMLSTAYGSAAGGANWAPGADFTGDGRVDVADLGVLSTAYGKDLTAVPSP